MDKEWDEWLSAGLKRGMDQIPWDGQQQEQQLAEIHRICGERRKVMRISGKMRVAVLAAAIVVMGSITAVAAGKVVGLVGGTSKSEAITSIEQLRTAAEKGMGGKVKILDVLADGSAFEEGYVTKTKGLDADGNVVAEYPNVKVFYGDISLSVDGERVGRDTAGSDSAPAFQETYGDVVIRGSEDAYLFLPPDAEPSEADRQLEAAGKLYISYGSAKEERKVFRSVRWSEDGMTYLLFTYGGTPLEELSKMAKEFVDAE